MYVHNIIHVCYVYVCIHHMYVCVTYVCVHMYVMNVCTLKHTICNVCTLRFQAIIFLFVDQTLLNHLSHYHRTGRWATMMMFFSRDGGTEK